LLQGKPSLVLSRKEMVLDALMPKNAFAVSTRSTAMNCNDALSTLRIASRLNHRPAATPSANIGKLTSGL
jgi:hypothetical protein